MIVWLLTLFGQKLFGFESLEQWLVLTPGANVFKKFYHNYAKLK